MTVSFLRFQPDTSLHCETAYRARASHGVPVYTSALPLVGLLIEPSHGRMARLSWLGVNNVTQTLSHLATKIIIPVWIITTSTIWRHVSYGGPGGVQNGKIIQGALKSSKPPRATLSHVVLAKFCCAN